MEKKLAYEGLQKAWVHMIRANLTKL